MIGASACARNALTSVQLANNRILTAKLHILLHPLKYISQCNIESKISSHRGGLITPIPHHINPSDKVVTKLNLDELQIVFLVNL